MPCSKTPCVSCCKHACFTSPACRMFHCATVGSHCSKVQAPKTDTHTVNAASPGSFSAATAGGTTWLNASNCCREGRSPGSLTIFRSKISAAAAERLCEAAEWRLSGSSACKQSTYQQRTFSTQQAYTCVLKGNNNTHESSITCTHADTALDGYLSTHIHTAAKWASWASAPKVP